MSKIKVGIIGAGDISQFHIKTLQKFKNIEITSIADTNMERADDLASRFHINGCYGDYADLIGTEKPDVVHVLTPPQTHYLISRDAMVAGCNVLIEKPMAMKLDEALEMESVAEETGRYLSVCEMYNFDPIVQAAKKLIQSGEMGNVIYMENYWFTDITAGTNAYSFKGKGSGWALDLPGGAFSNFIDHPLYLQREFLGEIQDASVRHKKLGDNPFIPYDELQITLSGKDSMGYIFSSLVGKPRINMFRIYCDEGIVTGDISNMALTTSKNRKIPNFLAKGVNNLSQSYELFNSTFKTTTSILTGKIKPRQGLIGFLTEFYEHYGTEDPVKAAPLSYDIKRFVETIRLSEMILQSLPKQRKPKRFIKKFPKTVKTSGKSSDVPEVKPILVTGAGGFLGKALVDKLLDAGNKVRVVTRKINTDWENNDDIEIIYGDIREIDCVKAAVEGVDKICHCAAHVTNKGQYSVFKESNVDATRYLLDYSLEYGVQKFIFISSIIVYGFQSPGTIMEESSTTGLNLPYYSYYATSKIEAEEIVNSYHAKRGIKTAIIRPGIIFGRSTKPSKGKFKIVFGSRRDILPYVYIQDVVDAIILTMNMDAANGETYNIVGEENVGQRYFLKAQNTSVNTSPFLLFIPKFVMFGVAYLLERLFKKKNMNYSPPFGLFHYKSLIRNMKYSNLKAIQELGWEPKFDIKSGFSLTNEKNNLNRIAE